MLGTGRLSSKGRMYAETVSRRGHAITWGPEILIYIVLGLIYVYTAIRMDRTKYLWWNYFSSRVTRRRDLGDGNLRKDFFVSFVQGRVISPAYPGGFEPHEHFFRRVEVHDGCEIVLI